MKYCPNLDCSYLEATGRIAEYQDNIDFCPDCDSELAAGEAPFVLPRGGAESKGESPNDAPLFPDDLAAVSAVDDYEDALWLKEELEKVGIPAVIRIADDRDDENDTDEADDLEDGDEPSPAFEIKVMGRHSMPALNLVQTLLDEESDEWAADGIDDGVDEGVANDSNERWDEDGTHEDADYEAITPRFVTNPLVVLLCLFCVLLAVGYLLLVGFPGS